MPRKISFVAIFLIIIVLAYNLINQMLTTLKSGDRLSQASEQLHQLEIKNKELKNKLSEVKSPLFIEKQARDKLGLAKEGETVVVIPEDKLSNVLGLKKETKEAKVPNWQGWLQLFFK